MLRKRFLQHSETLTPFGVFLGLFGGYLIWIVGFNLLILTLTTYILMATHSKLQDISEVFAANEIIINGFSAFAFLTLLRWLYPLTSARPKEIFTAARFESFFTPGFFKGAILALLYTLVFLASGHYWYLGFFIQVDETPLVVFDVIVRLAALGAMIYCEEYIFRQKLLSYLKLKLRPWIAIFLTASAFIFTKGVQFDLDPAQVLTLFLIALYLGVLSDEQGDFVYGAGWLCGLLIVFHTLLGLSIYGNTFPGVLLLKYQVGPESFWSKALTGGSQGPLSGILVQTGIFILLMRIALRRKKILLTSPEEQ